MATSEDIPQCGKWQPIESAPAVGKKRLLFWTKYGIYVVGHRLAGTKTVYSQGNLYIATHWMPLPLPPEAES